MRNTVSNYLKLAVIAGAFAAGSLAAAAPAQADAKYSDPKVAIQHYIDCANWLVSDPAKHAQFCSPGHDVFVSGSTGFAGGSDSECIYVPQESGPPLLECPVLGSL